MHHAGTTARRSTGMLYNGTLYPPVLNLEVESLSKRRRYQWQKSLVSMGVLKDQTSELRVFPSVQAFEAQKSDSANQTV